VKDIFQFSRVSIGGNLKRILFFFRKDFTSNEKRQQFINIVKIEIFFVFCSDKILLKEILRKTHSIVETNSNSKTNLFSGPLTLFQSKLWEIF
jgi:hypothetical protein